MTFATVGSAVAALSVRVQGLVQGVGFRPFVHRIAARHGLTGWVRNAAGEVDIAVEGAPSALDGFLQALRQEAPPLARIEQVDVHPVEPTGAVEFTILPSADRPDGRQPVSPDVGTCAACEAELFDPANRRYRYPFITCTDCGPRFTVIEAMPYDRERTSMRAFTQCAACRREYQSPADRRFHSETNACAECGPHIWFETVAHPDRRLDDEDALNAAAESLLSGAIVAIRGLGGFHLAVDATDQTAVARLRERKHRDAKPLAVMARTLAEAGALGMVGPREAELLRSPARPIVLLERRSGAGLAPAVAPGLANVGVMLAYTPLHHLLLHRVARPLVMTSGNRSEEPIAMSNDQARDKLRWIADAFLLHDRDIVSRYDDSVVRVAGDRSLFLRRARGYAPMPLDLPVSSPRPLLAVGGHLKHTFTLVEGSRAYISQHVGDLDNPDTTEHFLETLLQYRRLFRIHPVAVARDLHPDYLSSRIADEMGLSHTTTVQHHHAHIAAVLAEHGSAEPVVGVAFDGTGYGDDGTTWGSEFLVADLAHYRRVGHLRYAPLPGGDLAARRPWRAAMGYLGLDPSAERSFRRAFVGVDPRELDLTREQIRHRLNAPPASSMGRLFDAAAAILGIRTVAAYEGQAAMELESLAGTRHADALEIPVFEVGDKWVLDPLPLLAALGDQRAAGRPVEDLAAAFHESVAAATAAVAGRAAQAARLSTVVLGGGVFQNARLLESVRARLTAQRLRVWVPRRLPPNDGALSYGQAAVAAQRLALKEIGG